VGGSGFHQQLGEPQRPERRARRQVNALLVPDHELHAATTDVDDERRLIPDLECALTPSQISRPSSSEGITRGRMPDAARAACRKSPRCGPRAPPPSRRAEDVVHRPALRQLDVAGERVGGAVIARSAAARS
jgi:hypothetical protein